MTAFLHEKDKFCQQATKIRAKHVLAFCQKQIE